MTGTVKFIWKFKHLICMLCIVLLFNSCNSASDEETGDVESLRKGTIHISADESFKPVIDQQVQVFESSYPEAKIIVHYKPEAECLKDFAVDPEVVDDNGLQFPQNRVINVGINLSL